MTPRISRPTVPAGLRYAAVLTLFSFGCATVRVPASAISGTVPVRGGVAEPQVELWVESGRKVSPAESAEATAQAKAALQSALARVAAPRGDALLVVRAQGVARTSSRRADQHAAIAGLVIGAVVVVAAVVVVLVASQGKGGGGGGPRISLPRGAPAPHAVPRAVPVPIPTTLRASAPSPRLDVDVFTGVEVPSPGPAAPAEYAEYAEYAAAEPPEGWPSRTPSPPDAAVEELAAVTLPPPPPLPVAQRGFFDGDTLRLELVVVDRRDGTPRWSKVVDAEIDPRDARAVERLLGEAVANGDGWVPAVAAPDPAATR